MAAATTAAATTTTFAGSGACPGHRHLHGCRHPR
jgi:hypothetical protein